MYRLVALDLDGTLLNDRGEITEENAGALGTFFRRGGIVVLASGRMTDCITPFAEKMNIDCPIISYNGAMVRLGKSEKGKCIYHMPINPEHSGRVIEYCTKNSFLLNCYVKDVLYAKEDKCLRKYAQIYSRQTGAVYHFIKNIETLKGCTCTKLILITDVENEKDRSRTRDFQYEYFSTKISDSMRIVKTNPEYLEFMNAAASKGTALDRIAEYFGVDIEKEVIAFGDGENDIEMLEHAGLSVAPANAKEKVRNAADVVLEWDNNRSAVGRFLKKVM